MSIQWKGKYCFSIITVILTEWIHWKVFQYLQRSMVHSLRNTALFQWILFYLTLFYSMDWEDSSLGVSSSDNRSIFCSLYLWAVALWVPNKRHDLYGLWIPISVYQRSASHLGIGKRQIPQGENARLTPTSFPSLLNLGATNPHSFYLPIWSQVNILSTIYSCSQ